MLQQVENLESKMINNVNCVNTPHSSVYQSTVHLNTILNNLEGFVDNVEAQVNQQENAMEKSDGVSVAFVCWHTWHQVYVSTYVVFYVYFIILKFA